MRFLIRIESSTVFHVYTYFLSTLVLKRIIPDFFFTLFDFLISFKVDVIKISCFFFVITAFFSDSCTFTLKFHRSRIAISGSREKGFQSTEYKISQIPLCIEEEEIKQEVATSLSHAVKSQKKARKIKLAQVVCNWFLWMDASINFAISNHQFYQAGWHFHSSTD